MSTGDEFRARWTGDAQIEVEDIAEGHVWTFTIVEAGDGARILSPTVQHSPDHYRADKIAGRVYRHADRLALQEGKIDRLTAQ